jgi:hypothetical protein
MAVPLWLAGGLTIVAFVGLGVFLYPLWLRRSVGRVLVAGVTAVLAMLFYWFDGGRTDDPALRMALASLWAVAPLIVGLIVTRIGSPNT